MYNSKDIPDRTGPLTSNQEGKIVVELIGEIQRNLALELDPTPIASRSVGSKSVEDMVAHVKAELVERFYSAVIFQLLDNNIFFSKFEDGSLCLAVLDHPLPQDFSTSTTPSASMPYTSFLG